MAGQQQDIDSLIKEVNADFEREKSEIIEREIQKVLLTYKITEKNLSKELLNRIKQGASQQSTQSPELPMPLPLPIPKRPADASDDLLDKEFVAKIISDLLSKNNVFLYGKAGTGKTYTARKIADLAAAAAQLKGAFYIINCSQWTSPINIIGGQTIDGYREGQLIKAWRDGGTLILDELPKLDPNTAGLLNEALAATAEPAGYEITDGKGDKIPKNENFYVIATGNTDMKSQSLNYSGNNRQDYSLIDRFVGSFHYVNYNEITEMSRIYPRVYKIALMLRTYIDSDPESFESVSLRTMLNFSRTYQAEMLHNIGSKFAQNLEDYAGANVIGKSLSDSVNSLIATLPMQKQAELQTKAIAVTYKNIITGDSVDVSQTIGNALGESENEEEFVEFFKYLHLTDPITAEPVTKKDCKYPVPA